MKYLLLFRTALVVVLLGLMLLVALFMCAHWKLDQAFFTAAKDGCVALAAIAAMKSGVEHLANGQGLSGMVKNLVTKASPTEDTKPGA